MNTKKTIALFAVLALLAAPAWADWIPGDPYKMHYPQLPDPNGWDVSFSQGALGDDWLCTETGPVNDIHLWVSFRGDNAPGPLGVVGGTVEIWSDVPQGPPPPIFSYPGEPLWGMTFDTGMPNVTMRHWPSLPPVEPQGWLEPPSEYYYPDHYNTYQINIAPVSASGIEPFVQKRGEVYWLVANLWAIDPENPVPLQIGWKTSGSDQFRDDAVFAVTMVPPWRPLVDPYTSQSLDLAFVITVPEPATIVLVMLGLVGALAISRRANK